MEKKECTQCKHFLLFESFKNNNKTTQLMKCCIRCSDICKKSRQQTKCKHGRQRSKCKDCAGSQICEHNKQRSQCKDCVGSQICEHSKQKSKCKGCGGSEVCERNKRRSHYKDCGRSQICEHNKRMSICNDCGGSQTSEHNNGRSRCQDCGGSEVCEHNKIRSRCKDCNPLGYFAYVVRGRVYIALKSNKEMSSTEYLGCNIETFKKHIEQQFEKGMSWENYREWHTYHKIPLKYNKPLLEGVAQRLHYTKTQPMWAIENISKGCRYTSG